jgi:dipeptidyl-peptidase-4
MNISTEDAVMMRLLISLIIITISLHAHADASEGESIPLTIERIFSNPALSGSTLREVKLSPAGDRVTFIQGSEDDQDLMDLWEYHIADGQTRLLVAADSVLARDIPLSDEEKARRERARISSLRGIVSYQWSADGRFLLFPLGGNIYVLDLTAINPMVRQITNTTDFDTDPKIAPNGQYVAYIRNQNIWVSDLETLQSWAITSDGQGVIKNGMAEFVAQEEMDRSTGYWWSPNSDAIAFLKVDESPIDVSRRYEVNANQIEMIEQRYPYAGTPNVIYQLGIADFSLGIDNTTYSWVELGAESDIYIPRVQWMPDGTKLTYQRQSRDQKTLTLVQFDRSDASQTVLVQETSDTWINLHHNLHFLNDGSGFIWSSERTGYQHLYLYDFSTNKARALTQGQWPVEELVGVDEETGLVYFTAAHPTPMEKQLLRTSLATQSPEAITQLSKRSGWHDVNMDRHAQVYVDRYSSTNQPPQLSLHRADGARIAWLVQNAVDESHPYYPHLALHRSGEFGTLVGSEAQTLHYKMIRPPHFDPTEQYPVFVHIYGGPTSRLATNQWSRRALIDQFMAQQGYIVFSLDNRGVERQGKAFQDAAYQRLGRIEMVDQMVGIDWLKSQRYVDSDRIGIFGWSYGGYLSLMAASQYPGTFGAIVSVAPVTDWRLYDTHYTERYMGDPNEDSEAYELGNVLTYADQISDPLLLIHGMADDNVLFTHSTLLMQRLQDAAIPFELMTYPGEKHSISGVAQRRHVYETIVRFLNKELNPQPMHASKPNGGTSNASP